MTKYDAILLVFVVFFALFAGYFGYREYTDPILFPGGEEQSVSGETGDQAPPQPVPSPAIPTETPALVAPEPEPEAPQDLAETVPPVDPGELQKSVEEALTQQVGQLAALMENRLASSLEDARDRIAGQSEKLQSADEIIQQALGAYQESAQPSLEDLSETLGLIDEMQSESEAITSGLENARTAWDQLFDDVSAIGERSDDRLDEANFEFQTYAVGAAETLSEIAKRLESEYNLPESDLSFLLNRFNDIEYRINAPGGRRPSYRVVANDSLRVPVPKTAGTILEDYALPEKLDAQISYINQATTANTSLQRNLTRQVGKLRQLEAGVQAMAAMSEALADIDLSTDFQPAQSGLTPEMQDAWQQFESAVTDFRSADGYEEEQLARENLKGAISRLLEQYEDSFLETADTESTPLEYYLRFIETYRPGKSGL